MKHAIKTILLLVVLSWIVVFLVSRVRRPAPQVDTRWSPQQSFSQSGSALVSSFSLYKWDRTIITQSKEGGALKYSFYDDTKGAWKEKAITDFPPGDTVNMADPGGKGVVFIAGAVSEKSLEMRFACGMLDPQSGLNMSNQRKMIFDQTQLFQNLRTNQSLGDARVKPYFPDIGRGFIDGLTICIPYCLQGDTLSGNAIVSREEPFDNGVFASSDFGATWQREHVAELFAFNPAVAKTEKFYYYLAAREDAYELSYARKPGEAGSWESPQTLAKTLVTSGIIPNKYVVTTENEVIHVCWLDQRHGKRRRFNLMYPLRGNYEIAYSQRHDSDANWSKDVILSEGLQYAYSPTMSVEGQKIVVAWAGAPKAESGDAHSLFGDHIEFDPNDIYYVTSKDGGKTWTKPLRVTDNIKTGVTAGMPQVALHNGVIHLFYIQGEVHLKELSPGLTKLNLGPWPIYYQQRPFPE